MNYKSLEELPLFISAPQLAEVLGISRASAYQLLHDTTFPSIRVTEKRLVCPRDGLIAWLEQNAGRLEK